MILTVKSNLKVEEKFKKEFKRGFESLKGFSFCISLEFVWPKTDEPLSLLFLGDVVIPRGGIASKLCGLLQQNLNLEGLVQHVALILWRPDSSTKDSVEKYLIFRNSKR